MAITIAVAVVVVLILIEIVSAIVIRNRMIGARIGCEQAWSGIDVQLKRRRDLVPSLVETVKGYASHEREVFERVANARAEAMAARGVGPTAQAEQQLTLALVDLRAVAENYPTLRATENFQQLSSSLVEIEGKIQVARDAYNADVQGYNTKIQIFPNSLIARRGGFRPREFFQIEAAAEREPVAVSFGT